MKPTSHWQSLIAVLPADELVFIGHASHSAGPARALNLPVEQAVQGPPSTPVWPALHWQADWVVLATAEKELAAQF